MEIVATAVWVHLLATVALVGYYAVLAAIILPALSTRANPIESLEIVAALERRALPILIASLVAFLATGIYLTTADSRYGGVGNVGGSWTTILLIKHIVVVGMLVVGSVLDGWIVRSTGPGGLTHADALHRVTLVARAMGLLGAVVLLLTAVAQST